LDAELPEVQSESADAGKREYRVEQKLACYPAVKINSGSKEQSRGIEQVSNAIHSVETITQQNAAASSRLRLRRSN
jgi:methyl-accepting chemotaxis protein